MKFSLIIPVAPYRDAEILGSIKNLDFPKKEYEVIIERGPNASDNRNRGFEKSKGKVVVFIDDDGVIEKNFLKKADKFFSEHPETDIAGGPQITPKDERGFAKISGYALSSVFGGGETSKRYEKKKLNLDADETSITSAILFCKRKVLEKVKFDTNLWPGEDPKFIKDSKKAGFKVAYSPDLIIYHRRRPTAEALIKQIFNYGKVSPFRENFCETLKKPFFLIPSLFVIYLISLLIMADLSFFGINIMKNILLFLPLIVYAFLDLIFSFYESIKNRYLKSIFLLPFIFPVIHISYGLGRIYGYIKKIF